MRPVFIVGCDRSGTTLLASMLNEKYGCYVIPESHFLGGIIRKYYAVANDLSPSIVREIIEYISSHWRFRIWNYPIPHEFYSDNRNVKTIDNLFINLVAQYCGCRDINENNVWIDHTPSNVGNIHSLFNMFVGAKAIHIVRDGRAVAASLLPLDWGPNTIKHAIPWWCKKVCWGLAAESKYPHSIIRCKYEDLVCKPEKELERITGFIGINKNKSTKYKFTIPTYTTRQHKLIGDRPRKERICAWKNKLSQNQIRYFEYETGDLLQYLNYEPVYGAQAGEPSKWRVLWENIYESIVCRLNRIRHKIRYLSAVRN